MRNLKLTMIAVTAVAGALALAGCGGGSSSSTEASSAPAAASSAAAPSEAAAPAEPVAEGAKVLWVQPMLQHPVHQLMQAGFLEQCKADGLTCDVVGNPSATSYDVPASVALADAAIATTDYDVVAIYGPDPSINSYMEKIAATGTPVVTWHVLPEEGSIKGLAAATGQDIQKAGQNAAKAMGEALGGKGVVAVTQGSFNQSEDALSAAFTETLNKDFPDIKVLQPQEEGFDPSAAQAKAVSILQGNADVSGAFSTTGAGAATWAGAKRTSGRDLTIIGVDYVRQNLDLVKDGSVYGLVAQPLYEESAMIADLASQLAKGEKVQYLNLIDAPVVTTANLDSYYAILDSAGQ
jgi:ribose transport system substrate-binding protein